MKYFGLGAPNTLDAVPHITPFDWNKFRDKFPTLPCHANLYSLKMQEKHLYEMLHDNETAVRYLMSCLDEDYDSFLKELVSFTTSDLLLRNFAPWQISGIFNTFDNFWIARHALLFSVPEDALDSTKYSLSDITELGIGDESIVVNFTRDGGYSPWYLQLAKSTDKILARGVPAECYTFGLNFIADKDSGFFNCYTATIIKDLWPRVYIESTLCQQCDVANHHKVSIVHKGMGPAKADMCLVGERHSTYCDCCTFPLGAHKALQIMMYVCYCYRHRRVLSKTDSKPRQRRQSFVAVKQTVEVNNAVADIPLEQIVHDKGKVEYRRVGGHHASPREHIRRSFDRHYKSGKVSHIEQIVVNRGNKGRDSVISYKVPAKK